MAASSGSERRAPGILLSEQAALLLWRAGRTPRTWPASRPQCNLPFTFPHAQNRAPSKFKFALYLVWPEHLTPSLPPVGGRVDAAQGTAA